MTTHKAATINVRNVYGEVFKRENCYDQLKVTNCSNENNLIRVGVSRFAIIRDISGGGSFALVPHANTGRLPHTFPVVNGHTKPVTDLDICPYDETVIASGSEDASVMIWSVPQNQTENISNYASKLSGHERKISTVQFHPTIRDMLVTSSFDTTIKIWDIKKVASLLTFTGHEQPVSSVTFSYTGRQILSTSKDRTLRLFDLRSRECEKRVKGHEGAKTSRAVWLGDSHRILTTGFGRAIEREMGIWDIRQMETPVCLHKIDNSAGLIMPFYDPDTQIAFLIGKGDGNIRYYTIKDDSEPFGNMSEYKSTEAQIGAGFMPRRALNAMNSEVARVYKVVKNNSVEPVTFRAQRKSDHFQTDLYPDTFSGEPSMTMDEFFSGAEKNPLLVSMESIALNKSGNAATNSQTTCNPTTTPKSTGIGSSSCAATSNAHPSKIGPQASKPEISAKKVDSIIGSYEAKESSKCEVESTVDWRAKFNSLMLEKEVLVEKVSSLEKQVETLKFKLESFDRSSNDSINDIPTPPNFANNSKGCSFK